jgi:hypothetical protein
MGMGDYETLEKLFDRALLASARKLAFPKASKRTLPFKNKTLGIQGAVPIDRRQDPYFAE